MNEPEPKSLGEAYSWVFGTAALPLLLPLMLLGRDSQSDSYGRIQDLGFIVIPIGWTIAPSMGRMYAGDYKAGLGGIGLRLGALAATGAVVLPCMFGGCNEALIAIPVAAGGIWIGSVVYDTFWGTYRSVRKHNAKISLSPYIPRLGSTGLSARVEF
ncbi:MAG: hypothetical protein ABIW76_17530 [Fibrobacteria bacterium]